MQVLLIHLHGQAVAQHGLTELYTYSEMQYYLAETVIFVYRHTLDHHQIVQIMISAQHIGTF